MRIITHQDAAELLTMQACIDLMEHVLKDLSVGEAEQQLRTAAVSAVATKLLARPESDVLAMLGTGEQARTDFLIPLQEGMIGLDHIFAEIGDLLLNRRAGRQSEHDITIFKSLGLAIEDVAAAHFIYQEAMRQGKGTDAAL